jgi:predicted AAA+ superfamily ATPase
MDCGLASFLMGLHEPKDLKKSREWGALFETLVFQHLKAWASLKIPSPRIFYWRTATGQEIDFVIEWGNKLVAIEVKSSSMVKYSDAENLRVFIGEYPGVCAGIVVYTGNSLRQIGKKIWAVPWEMLV